MSDKTTAEYVPKLLDDPELELKWLEALRSGDYKQGRGVLCRADDDGSNITYCCLGALKAIVEGGVKPGPGLTVVKSDAGYHGLTPDAQSILIRMNDTDKLSFRQIADAIECGEVKE